MSVKISELTEALSVTGADYCEVVQAGANRRVSLETMFTFAPDSFRAGQFIANDGKFTIAESAVGGGYFDLLEYNATLQYTWLRGYDANWWAVIGLFGFQSSATGGDDMIHFQGACQVDYWMRVNEYGGLILRDENGGWRRVVVSSTGVLSTQPV